MFIEDNGVFSIHILEFGEYQEAAFKDAINQGTQLERAGIVPSLLHLLMEQLDVPVTRQDIVCIVHWKGLIAASMNETNSKLFNPIGTTMIIPTSKSGDIVTTYLEEPGLAFFVCGAW
jgi:hypothetical protein